MISARAAAAVIGGAVPDLMSGAMIAARGAGAAGATTIAGFGEAVATGGANSVKGASA